EARRPTLAGACCRVAAAREVAPCALQISALDRVRRRVAQDCHRQDPALQAARPRHCVVRRMRFVPLFIPSSLRKRGPRASDGPVALDSRFRGNDGKGRRNLSGRLSMKERTQIAASRRHVLKGLAAGTAVIGGIVPARFAIGQAAKIKLGLMLPYTGTYAAL